MFKTLFIVLILALFPLLVMAGGEVSSADAAATATAQTGVLDVGSAIRLVLGLFVVLFLIIASAWLFKRFGRWQGGYTDQLKVVGGLAVGARERIVVVQVGEQQLLIGIAPGNIRTLHVLDESLPPVDLGSMGKPIAEKFAAVLKKQRNGRVVNEASTEK